MTYLSSELFVEMLADGTIPKKVIVTRKRPTMLRPIPETASFEKYARADLEDTDLTLYSFEVPCPLDPEGLPWSDEPLYVAVTWVDEDGYNVELYTDPLKAAVAACSGWGEMSHVVEYDTGELDAGPNLLVWGGYGLTFNEGEHGFEIAEDPRELGGTAFVHLYERTIQ